MKIRAIGAAVLAVSASAMAGDLTFTVENMSGPGGFSFTPVWFGVHDGSFDVFNAGAASSGDLTAIAEGGDTGPLSGTFAAAQPGGAQMTQLSPMAAPPFTPGESGSATLSVSNTATNRYLSFSSMVVPSNDLFFGNDDAMGHEVYDLAGNFTGPFEILIFGRDVWDNGSEVNDAFGGAAFSANGGAGVDETGVVSRFFDDPDAASYLLSFVGTGTADGGTITGAFGEGSLLARITVVPAPGAVAALGLAGLVVGRRRR